MIRYLARRLLQGVFVLLAAFTASFVILYTMPGDPVLLMLGGGNGATLAVPTQAQIAKIEAEYGFNKPVIVQYFLALGHALTGNFGSSIQTGQNVTSMLSQSFVPTLQLASLALLLAMALGAGVALAATYTQVRLLQQLLLTLPSIGVSMPTFWTGLILIQVFSFHWPVFPALGNTGLRSLILPAITTSVIPMGIVTRTVRALTGDILSQDFVEALRAKGLRETDVFRHVIKNAAPTALAVMGLQLGYMLGGSILIETVFSWPGSGLLLNSAIFQRDLPLLQGTILVLALFFVALNLLVDIAQAAIDPRIKRS